MTEAKHAAAAAACDWTIAAVGRAKSDEFLLGLGSGSTAEAFVEQLGKAPRATLERICCVPTSSRTEKLALAAGLSIADEFDFEHLDLTVDGADEIDSELQMIKGGGGALLREKLVARSSDEMLVIADESKLVEELGRFPLPIEVLPFGVDATIGLVTFCLSMLDMADFRLGEEASPGRISIRRNGERFMTENGNLILDLALDRIEDPDVLDLLLHDIPGVVETGLFRDLADYVAVGAPDGSVRWLTAVKVDEVDP